MPCQPLGPFASAPAMPLSPAPHSPALPSHGTSMSKAHPCPSLASTRPYPQGDAQRQGWGCLQWPPAALLCFVQLYHYSRISTCSYKPCFPPVLRETYPQFCCLFSHNSFVPFQISSITPLLAATCNSIQLVNFGRING